MTYSVRSDQARCNALGVTPLLVVDGVEGPKTRRGISDAKALQAGRGRPFRHASGLDRIHLHWSAGGHKASTLDRSHYHVLIEGDGTVIRAHAPTTRLAHTLNANGGAIAVALCAMAGAMESPFNAGKSPITEAQLRVLPGVVRELCATYDIPVSPWSVLTHAEVQPTLGIKQRGKWDICWIPGFSVPREAVATGDVLRRLIGGYASSFPLSSHDAFHPDRGS